MAQPITPEQLTKIGVYPNFIRPSKAARLIDCPSQLVMSLLAEDDSGGAAAQTGSLVHAAAEAFHNADLTGNSQGKNAKVGLEALEASRKRFPLGDAEEAAKQFACYSQDPRNWRKLIAIEKQVEFFLEPHELDKTKQKIYIKGTLDQLGYDANGILSIYDIKTGSPDGWSMIHEYMIQQALYYLAARAMGFDVKKVYVIRTKSYRVRNAELPDPKNVFWYVGFSNEQSARNLVDRVRLEVALLRNGHINFGTGSHCVWCEHGGYQNCEPKLLTQLGIR